MTTLSWDDLRTFLAVAEQGTLAAAADRLGTHSSTVLRRLQSLEAALDANLVERSPRGSRLTPVGEALLPKVQEMNEVACAARRAVVGHDRTATGVVRLTMVVDLLDLVAPHLAAFRAAVPGVHVHVNASPDLQELGREADIALRLGNAPSESAVGRKIGMVGWARYACQDGDPERLPWIVYADHLNIPGVAWRRRYHPDAEVLLTVDGVSTAHHVLRTTRSQSMLPCHLGEADQKLRRIGPVPQEAGSALWMLIHADLRRSARVRALVDFLTPRLAAEASRLAGDTGAEPNGRIRAKTSDRARLS